MPVHLKGDVHLGVVVLFVRLQWHHVQVEWQSAIVLCNLVQVNYLVLQVELCCRDLERYGLLHLRVYAEPVEARLKRDRLCAVVALVETHAVVEEEKELVAEELEDFFIRLAVRAIVTLLKLHIHQVGALAVEVAADARLFGINAQELLPVEADEAEACLLILVELAGVFVVG